MNHLLRSLPQLFSASLLFAACGTEADYGGTDDELGAGFGVSIPGGVSLPPPAPILLRFPILHSDRAKMAPYNTVMHQDHDNLHGKNRAICTNFAGLPFPGCYNEH